MFNKLKKTIKIIIIEICISILEKVYPERNIILFLTPEEYDEYCNLKDSVFIIYENEEELKTDWPDAKEIIKKCTKDQIINAHHKIPKGEN